MTDDNDKETTEQPEQSGQPDRDGGTADADVSSGPAAEDVSSGTGDAGLGSGLGRRLMRNGLVLLGVFLAGYLLQFREVRALRRGTDELQTAVAQAERQLEIEVLGATMAGAALYAAHGDFEPAKRQTTLFFDGLSFLRMQVPTQAIAPLAVLATRRDDIVGILAARESFAVYQLADVFAEFEREMLGREYDFTVPMGLPER